ncbi:MAG TPA: sulfatase [Isosphaeraceae bacterium]
MTIRTVPVLALALLGAAIRPAPGADRPNIVLAIADDWSWPHAGAYGDRVVRTPVFDRLAAQGVKFTRAYCASPSCTPSRGAILTGQAVHRLEEGGNLWSILPRKFACYPDLLEAAGYHVGLTGKGWGPGTLEGSGRTRNPAGPAYRDFEQFLRSVPDGRPFCYWFGSTDPHRPYEPGAGLRAGLRPEEAVVPPFLPDTPEVRGDLLDYDFEVQRFDHAVGEIVKLLEETGQADNTLVIITSDNGMPFPRAKANVYDHGSHEPLAIRWPAGFPGGRTVDAFVSLADLAPTILEAAGLRPLPEMTGRSLLGLLRGTEAADRDRVFVERERHANVRAGDLSFPVRAVRTRQFLYIRNLRPDRWPAGDPQLRKEVDPFGDVDGSPSKDFVLEHRADPKIAPFFRLAFAKRPAEELYDLAKDPGELTNVADRSEYAQAKRTLRAELDRWMTETADPRALADDDRWDRYPYVSGKTQPRSR